jgi:hypothetical protein
MMKREKEEADRKKEESLKRGLQKEGIRGSFHLIQTALATVSEQSNIEESLAKMRKPKSVPRQRVLCELCGKEVSVNTIGQHKKAYHCE